jgi:predicted RNA methylase
MFGVTETVKALLIRLVTKLLAYRPERDNCFDKRYGTDTMGIVDRKDLGISDEQARAAVFYVSCPVKFERYVLETLEIDYENFNFVDMGSGKGRVIMVASEYPFRSVTGVEISQKLCAIAQNNLRIFPTARQKSAVVHVQCMDAVLFPISNENTVFHFYHPFGADILRPVLNNIASVFGASDKMVRIVYIWKQLPEIFPLFDQYGFRRLRHVWTINPRYEYAIFTI